MTPTTDHRPPTAVYPLLARLLEYPSQELLSHASEIRQRIQASEELSDDEREALIGFVEWLTGQELMRLQEQYVQTFDTNPDHSLHITHHLYGEDRNRGPVLANLVDHYRTAGLEISENELPDYLPLMLEFISTQKTEEANRLLTQASQALSILSRNLNSAGSPYAAVVGIVERHSRVASTGEM